MSDPVGEKLYEAAMSGRASEVSSLLRDHPEIDVNFATNNEWTLLYSASFHDHVVVKLLLAHPNIHINLKNSNGETSLSLCCWKGRVSVVQVLLKDPRVDVTLDDKDGRTPPWWASCSSWYEVIEWLIASGRDLEDIEHKKGKYGGKDYTALEIARSRGSTEVASVLDRFMANPTQTRHEVRVKLGMLTALAAEVFALTVFLCDDLLQLRPASHLAATPNLAAAARFFVITKRLPMELRMILSSCCWFNEAKHSSQGL